MIDISICSYSFHRMLEAGLQDAFQYIDTCRQLGCTRLDPWNGHLVEIRKGDDAIRRDDAGLQELSAEESHYVAELKRAADAARLPFGCIAVDGAHIYETDLQKRRENRLRAYRWIEVAARLGAKQVRIDSGGEEKMTADVLQIIKEGFADVISVAKRKGIEVLVENHWGATKIPENVIQMLEAIPGLGFLWDSHNWKRELREQGRVSCAKYASCTHLKTFRFDALGNEISDEDAVGALRILTRSGYRGCWGVESVPEDADEITGAAKTIELIKKIAIGR
jgi:hypothetical protein